MSAGALEGLGAAGAASFRRTGARLTLEGAAAALDLAGVDTVDALLAQVAEGDRAAAAAAFAGAWPAAGLELTLRTGRRLRWLGDGAAGLVLPAQAGGRCGLTGLADRGGFLTAAERLLRTPGDKRLLLADLDRFARMNAALGPEQADAVLAALGARLAAACPGALCGRVGDDEFAVLQDEAADAEATLRAVLEAPLRLASFDLKPAVTIGWARTAGGEGAPSAGELLRRASVALAERRGGGKEGDAPSRLALEWDLRHAVERGEIQTWYQPVVRLTDGRLAGFEALARWRHPERGVVAPDEFIPLAAELGLLEGLGASVLAEAAAQLGRWRAAGADALTVAVNLSPGELDRPDLPARVAQAVRDAGLPPGALKLELTESEVVRDPAAAAERLEVLRAAGAGLSLDDFGAGYSSLSYLSRLPFDGLKIDRYFVRAMLEDPGAAAIVSSVVALGHELGLTVVAEGVEGAEQIARLTEMNCDFGQGFGYAPALTATEAGLYLEDSGKAGRALRRGWS